MRYRTIYVLEQNITCIYDGKMKVFLPMEYETPNEAIYVCRALNAGEQILNNQVANSM